MKKLSTAGLLLLLIIHASPVLAAGRTIHFPMSLQTVAVSIAAEEQTSDLSLLRNSERVTRASFIIQAVEALFGELKRSYSAPYQNIPAEARNAIGLARTLGAVEEWGRDGQWENTITRGEMLNTLFFLAKMEPQAGDASFTDVRGKRSSRIAAQAIAWKLFTPLTPRTFGWGRAVTADELGLLLERFAARVSAPLPLPVQGAETLPLREAPAARSRAQSPKATLAKKPTKARVIIEKAGLDYGRSLKKTALPKSDLLEVVWGIVQDKFLYEDRIDQEEIAYAIAETMLQKLGDPYSTFLRPKTNERFQQQIEGDNTFFGIGASVRIHEAGGVEVVTPLQNSPAMKAGVRPGDRVIAVDEKSVEKMELNDAVDLIRGPEGTTVKLTIIRKDVGGQMIISIIRGKIVLKDLVVTNQENVAIVQLNNFSREAMNEFNGVIKEAMGKAPIGMVLDLRNDPGGLLDAAILVSSHFLTEGQTVVSVARKGSTEHHLAVGGARPIPLTLPVIVLVNKGSASASEIVAGALKDHKRAEIMGQTTFGKGTVQEAVELEVGGGQSPAGVKVTIAKWLTPSGHEIDGKGVSPTIEFPEGNLGDRDEMLLEAIRLLKAKGGR
ncbi:MAG TPA: S41 family peptidase [Candidatus Peribacterales bacterium]|nr:S41 family peptidase [Candidatus Peribacterales bacterium]